MKGTVLILLCALALAQAYSSQRNSNGRTCNCHSGDAKEVCAPLGTDGLFVAHEHCNRFYQCYNGVPVTFECPANLLFNIETQVCDWPENVDCGDRPIVEEEAEDCDGETDGIEDSDEVKDNSSNDADTDNGGSDSGNVGGGNTDPSEAPAICAAEESDGILIAHENCNDFYKCFHGLPVEFQCGGNLLFNPNNDQCDWPENVECGDRIIPDGDDNGSNCDGSCDNGGSDNGGSDNGGSDNGGSDNGGSDNGGSDNGGSENGPVGGGNCDPSEAPAICAADQSEGVLVAHENCNYFYKCSFGLPVEYKCPVNLLFNPSTDQCDWPENVDCGDRVIPDEEDNSCSGNENGCDNGGSDNGGSDNDNGGSDNGGSDNGPVGGGNCDPSEAPTICAADESEGVLVAHEKCNYFYKCSGGLPVELICPGNLLFNPITDQCDWPENVECGDRVIPEEGDNDGSDNGGSDNGGSDNGGSDNGGSDNGGSDNGPVGGGNCDPSEAPTICAADESEGVLVAHEKCNYFYKCSGRLPVELICPGNLLFNPIIDQCDWPENVECGDRVIPEEGDNNGSDNGGSDNGGSDNGGSGNGGSDNGGSDNGGSDNGGSDNGGSDNGGSDNGGSDNGPVGGGNSDPSEAPAICAADQSEGVLVAHENCNYFYKCSFGLPVEFKCPVNLLFNPDKDQCDWPENVECGDRVIPDDDDNSCSDNDNGCDNGGSDNGGSDNGGSDNGGSDNGGSDNGGSDNGGSDNGPVGGGNCDPSEAPAICAADQSEGVLVAHENCNYFYKCANGLPIAFKCPGSLLFNPNIDQCDWPENVDCGDRIIPDVEDNSCSGNESGCDNGGNDNGGSDNGGSDNGGSDNGGSDNGGSDNGPVGGGNCDPSEAPTICAADQSEGVLVAHENCNYFYKCANGLPIAFKCPGNLLFNPNIDQCDWPVNVDCGDRVIPDEEDNSCSGNGSGCDNGGSDNVSNENGGSDNGGSDNGGSDNGGSDNGSSDNGGSDNGAVGGCNCDPSEAPAICAADESEGVLVAHENCNYFYKCSFGLPVEYKCPVNLLFNPHSDQCDWPENVDCGDRVIPDESDNDGSDNGGSDNGGSDNGGSDNGGSDNGGSDNGGSDNGPVGGGNCDPSEAPAICAADESEGVLVAHEKCNYFYKCSGGLPVELICPGNLLFNPITDQCDYPENVECGDRVIPEEGDNDSSDNGGSDNGGSDNGGSDNGGSDNGGTDNGGSDNGTIGGGNCDPSEAPAICAADQSEGVLVAHEKCNYFYKCSSGLPVELICPGNLLFDPSTDQCDWPENVDCGDRIIPVEGESDGTDNGGSDNGGSDNGGSDNGGSDNEGSDNGGGDNGGSDNGGSDNGGSDNEGSVNDNPSLAPSICASAGTEGVFIAHEECNKYYMCINGVPVPVQCSGTLMFNPLIGVCDWPRNVDCGDRIVPETDDSGTCNCNFRQAPSICIADGSNGKLIVHEECNKFFICSEGVPVARSCPRSLLYDPMEEACKRAQDVSCEDRVLHYSLDKHIDSRLA